MKKWLSLLMILALACSVLCFNVQAEEELENFVPENNATFETGTPTWSTLGGGNVSVVDNPAGEGKVLAYSNIPADKSYATPLLNVKDYILNKVDEEVTIYGKLDVYCVEEAGQFLIRIRTKNPSGFSMCEEGGYNYCMIARATGKTGAWSTVYFSFDILESDLASTDYWNLCFDNISGFCTSTFYIDNLYLGVDEPEVVTEFDDIELPQKTAIKRQENTLIGTIRWDAFTESTPTGNDPASQVARVLSPQKYHCQAPYFSKVEANGTISFPEYTVQTWEQEAAYAVAGGLDYFAYLWYETDSAMAQPRKYHLMSEKKDTIKMCGILETIRSEKSMNELFVAMKDSCYLTLDGRPVLFLYGIDGWEADAVEKVRKMAVVAGIEKSLYIVGMDGSTSASRFLQNVAKGIDAVSWYAVGADKTGMSYAELAANCEEMVTKLSAYAKANSIDIIPSFTTGRDTQARIETGVSWVDGDPNAANDKDKPYKNYYAYQPTMEELAQHMENVILAAKNNTDSKANLVVSYGWNEHEEGGWLCPTLACDADGNVIYNEDGTAKANTERLDTLKAVVDKLASGNAGTGDAGNTDVENGGEGGSTTETPDPNADNSNVDVGEVGKKFNVLFVIIPAVVVVAAVAVVVVVVLKKKKSEN